MLPKYEQHNSAYKDVYGQRINDLITWSMQDCGWNTFRVRIFVNPDPSKDASVCQDLAYVTALGQRIKAAGGYFMLDFHYSDTWVDATHIQAPTAWKNASNEEMAQHVADYTREGPHWKRSVFIPIPKKGNVKECSNYHTIAFISHASKVMLKILQARLQQYINCELPDVQAGFIKGRGSRDQIANIR